MLSPSLTRSSSSAPLQHEACKPGCYSPETPHNIFFRKRAWVFLVSHPVNVSLPTFSVEPSTRLCHHGCKRHDFIAAAASLLLNRWYLCDTLHLRVPVRLFPREAIQTTDPTSTVADIPATRFFWIGMLWFDQRSHCCTLTHVLTMSR